MKKPKGIRFSNPGNIEYGPFARKYGGTRSEDGRFARFPTMVDGIRAIGELLLAYYAKPLPNKIDTIQEIIERWAPSSENNVAAYVATMCEVTGLEPDDPLDITDYDTLWWLTAGIMEHECGHDAVLEYVDDDDITAGIELALMD